MEKCSQFIPPFPFGGWNPIWYEKTFGKGYIYIYIIYQYWVNVIPPILIFSHLDLLKASWLIICLSNHANMLFWDILSLWKVKCSPKMAKNMNCKTNNHRHILSQIYAHHIQAFVGYNIRIWAVYPCTSVYLYGTKFNLHVLLDSRMFVAVKLLCLVGGWATPVTNMKVNGKDDIPYIYYGK